MCASRILHKQNSKRVAVFVVCLVLLNLLQNLPQTLQQLRGNKSTTTIKGDIDATSGKLFRMFKRRAIENESLLRFQAPDKRPVRPNHVWPEDDDFLRPLNFTCTKWGTITTIFPVTNATASMARMPGWCLLVAGDVKGPDSYEIPGANVVFLSSKRQEELARKISFVAKTPWNHFSRKNIAYLYAIANGAVSIWDFDDDNALFPDETLEAYTKPSESVLEVDVINPEACSVFNPYGFFGASVENIWPRGYPLECLHDEKCKLASDFCVVNNNEQKIPIGIFQAIEDLDPDVDAIYRLTRELPVHFAGAPQNLPVVVPENMYSPMNAQAALFQQMAFWSLFLPTTVHGRVSDIWRSYIAQTLMKQVGMRAAFIGPVVEQVRNAHSYLADLDAEVPLYEQAGALIDYLQHWTYNGNTLEGAMERLYVDLYEHGILEWEDVALVQLWLTTLQGVGYKFPVLSPKRKGSQEKCTTKKPFPSNRRSKNPPSAHRYYNHVVLVGQFNYNMDPSYVIHWVRRWNEIFRHVQVRGPFNASNIEVLREQGVQTFPGADDAGYVSPMKNLANSLRMFANDTSILGVIITHDDLVFNLTHLESLGFPSSTDILCQTPLEVMEKPYLYFRNDSTFRRWDRPQRHAATAFASARLKGWRWWEQCIPPFAKASSLDSRGHMYADGNWEIALYANSPGDFVYVPTSLAVPLADMADWLVDSNVFLECGMPTLFARMRDSLGAKVKFVEYCTTFSRNRTDYATWVPSCAHGAPQTEHYYFPQKQTPLPPYGLYHPLKLMAKGLDDWDEVFDLVTEAKQY